MEPFIGSSLGQEALRLGRMLELKGRWNIISDHLCPAYTASVLADSLAKQSRGTNIKASAAIKEVIGIYKATSARKRANPL